MVMKAPVLRSAKAVVLIAGISSQSAQRVGETWLMEGKSRHHRGKRELVCVASPHSRCFCSAGSALKRRIPHRSIIGFGAPFDRAGRSPGPMPVSHDGGELPPAKASIEPLHRSGRRVRRAALCPPSFAGGWIIRHFLALLLEQLLDSPALRFVGRSLQQFFVVLDILAMEEPFHVVLRLQYTQRSARQPTTRAANHIVRKPTMRLPRSLRRMKNTVLHFANGGAPSIAGSRAAVGGARMGRRSDAARSSARRCGCPWWLPTEDST